jgi:site-specific DNA-cytosine methylase
MGATLNAARIKAAGNSIVPGIAEVIGRAVIRVETQLAAPLTTQGEQT